MAAEFFRFEELTWPDAAALPRATPLVLPLGDGYDLNRLPGLLKASEPIGVLPAIPFGWPGSRLETPAPVFAEVVRSLVGNLLEDGFTSVHVLAPHGLDLGGDLPVLV